MSARRAAPVRERSREGASDAASSDASSLRYERGLGVRWHVEASVALQSTKGERVRRRVRRRARFVTRRGRRLLSLTAAPTVGAVLLLDDGREAIVREVRGEEMSIDVGGGVESVAFRIER